MNFQTNVLTSVCIVQGFNFIVFVFYIFARGRYNIHNRQTLYITNMYIYNTKIIKIGLDIIVSKFQLFMSFSSGIVCKSNILSIEW